MHVRALQDCYIDSTHRAAGEVFEHDGKALTRGVLVPVSPDAAPPPPVSVPIPRVFTPPEDGSDLLS
jgi:hypothetical protein